MARFERFIGIDYSGAGGPHDTCSGIAVFEGGADEEPRPVENAIGPKRTNWSRRELAEWLVKRLRDSPTTLVGLDHAFSPPLGDDWRDLDWDEVLRSCTERWGTHELSVSAAEAGWKEEAELKGPSAYRLTEQWTSSAKGVWDQRRRGVFKSTVAGIPWIYDIRQRLGDRVHFWPFDGWRPEAGRHVIAEVYPALFWRRYGIPHEWVGKPDRRDARAVVCWMKDMSTRQALEEYFSPPLTEEEMERARVEGWIFGVR